MTREELLTEIQAVKTKLAFSSSAVEQTRLTIALIALYDSIVHIDNQVLKMSA